MWTSSDLATDRLDGIPIREHRASESHRRCPRSPTIATSFIVTDGTNKQYHIIRRVGYEVGIAELRMTRTNHSVWCSSGSTTERARRSSKNEVTGHRYGTIGFAIMTGGDHPLPAR